MFCPLHGKQSRMFAVERLRAFVLFVRSRKKQTYICQTNLLVFILGVFSVTKLKNKAGEHF